MAKLEPKALTVNNVKARLIVDLHLSDTFRDENRKLRLRSRMYSAKTKIESKSWKLTGHSPRLLLTDVTFPVSQAGRRSVIANSSKTPHAYVQGLMIEHSISDEEHEARVERMKNEGAVYLAYDPYKVEGFCQSDTEHLPMSQEECDALPRIPHAQEVYCYEHGILAIV